MANEGRTMANEGRTMANEGRTVVNEGEAGRRLRHQRARRTRGK
jgi:hypothetical protein